MRRDVDLIRNILLSVENQDFNSKPIVMDDYNETNEHYNLMIQAGLLVDAKALTWAGYELLELIRDEGRWQAIKRVLNELNCYNFEIIKQIAIQQMKL
jgi:hypothetical protein